MLNIYHFLCFLLAITFTIQKFSTNISTVFMMFSILLNIYVDSCLCCRYNFYSEHVQYSISGNPFDFYLTSFCVISLFHFLVRAFSSSMRWDFISEKAELILFFPRNISFTVLPGSEIWAAAVEFYFSGPHLFAAVEPYTEKKTGSGVWQGK